MIRNKAQEISILLQFFCKRVQHKTAYSRILHSDFIRFLRSTIMSKLFASESEAENKLYSMQRFGEKAKK
jgi:hypothetical protein